jgi:hypothetical protein
MQIDNSLNSILNNPLLNNQQNSSQNVSTASTNEATKEAESEVNTAEKLEEKERENFGAPLLSLMNEDEYNGFLRATKGLDDATKSRYATSLQMFSATFINATTNGTNGMSLLNSKDTDSLESIIGQSAMLRVSEFSIREGADVLKNMAGENENMLDFMQRIKNALSSGKGIDVSG